MRALVVEDHANIARLLRDALETQGLVVDTSGDGNDAMAMAEAYPYDLLVLDRMLPGLDGDALCRRLRRKGSRVPILMLTARDTLQDKVTGLDLGADDYLVKPFEVRELQARVRALLRRGRQEAGNELRAGDLVMDLGTGVIIRGGIPISLGRKEAVLLAYLLRHKGRTVTKDELMDHAWNSEAAPDAYTVRTHICRLRSKVDRPGSRPLIQTVHGIGYRIDG